jgi:DNA polymerase-3 subunit beta
MFKIEVPFAPLLKAVTSCSTLALKSSSMTAVTKMLLSFDGENLTITGTDLEIACGISIPVDGEGSGDVAITPKIFADFLRMAKNPFITLELMENNSLKATSGDFQTVHLGISADKFPAFTDLDGVEFISIDAQALRDAINKTIYSVSTGEVNYNLKGVQFLREETDEAKTLRLISTDGQRINVATVKADDLSIFPEEPTDGGPPEQVIIIGPKGLKTLSDLCEPFKSVNISLHDNKLIAKQDDWVLTIRLLSGNFPDYKVIFSSELDYDLFANKKEFLTALKRISILTDDKYPLATFSLKSEVLNISSDNPELGSANTSISVDYNGPDKVNKVNPSHLIEAISTLGSDRVSLRLGQQGASYLIEGSHDYGYKGLVAGIEK